MIRRRSYIKRSAPPAKRRKGPRAALARECQALWSAAVKRKNDGACILRGWDGIECWGPIDSAHGFPKGRYKSIRYELWNGLPTCRLHHDTYGNSPAWKAVLWRLWGPALYAERYALAHTAGRKLDLAAVKAALDAA